MQNGGQRSGGIAMVKTEGTQIQSVDLNYKQKNTLPGF